MRLYGFWRSIAAYRVRAALNLKGLPYEEVDVDLLAGAQHRPDFLGVNPHAAVPALVLDDGRVLTQSLAIIGYLDTLAPQAPLLPADPYERAQAQALALVTIADAHPLVVPRVRGYLAKTLGRSEEETTAFIRHFVARAFETYEAHLAARPPAPFVFGETPGLADIAIASHCALGGFFGLALSDYPACAALMERLSGVEAIARAHPLARKAAVEARAG